MNKVEFTKEQFENLLKMAYVGNWVINSHRLDEDLIEKFEDLQAYLFAQAKSFGLEHLADETIDDEACPSDELEDSEEMMGYIDEYDNETFWNQLCDRLALRDACNKYGEEAIKNMDPEERFKVISEIECDYQEIVSQHGLEKVCIKE